MRGSVKYQVETLFRESGINQIGHSKHTAKEQVRQDFEARGEFASWHDIGQRIGIYSISCSEDYQSVWRQALEHAKEEFGIRDIEKLTPEIVADFLVCKVEQGVAKSTFDTYAAGAEKLGVALNWYAEKFDKGNTYSFSDAVKEVRTLARQELDKTQEARAYSDPRALIAAIVRPDHQLAAAIQLEAGSRVRECSNIKATDLRGIRPDPVSGQSMGWYEAKGKGGKDLDKMGSLNTYQKLELHIMEHGTFRIDGASYRDSLKAAAKATGQEYHGSHGLRWNFAQERYRESLESGQSSIQALKTVSEEMGHNRADITLHYLKG